MFHLRFYKPETLDNVNVYAKRYDSRYVNGVQIVTAYDKTHSGDGGTEFRVGEDYSECFVTNEAGKTVDRIQPPRLSDGERGQPIYVYAKA